jgi:hypothetical protein
MTFAKAMDAGKHNAANNINLGHIKKRVVLFAMNAII